MTTNIDQVAANYRYRDYLTNTVFINSLYTAPQNGSGSGIGSTAVDNWLSTVDLSSVNSVEDFVKKFAMERLGYPTESSIPSFLYDPTNQNSPVYNYYRIYTTANGYTTPSTTISNDDLNLISNPSVIAGFKQKFKSFLSLIKDNMNLFSTSVGGGAQVTINGNTYTPNLNLNSTNFYAVYASTFNITTVISNTDLINAGGIFGTNAAAGLDTNYVQSFQKIYEAFHGGSLGDIPANSALWTDAQRTYVTRLRAFYDSQMQTYGDFSATNALSDWYEYSLNLYTNPNYSPNPTNYDENGTLILNELLLSLIAMIGTIQKTAATQAQQLTFLAAWQNAYTNKLNQVHIFARSDGTDLGFGPNKKEWNDNDSRKSKWRDSLNTINQNYIARLQGNQSNVSDTAKSLQTNVNQSNDAANQQGSIADSILSQLSTILSAIFR